MSPGFREQFEGSRIEYFVRRNALTETSAELRFAGARLRMHWREAEGVVGFEEGA